MSELRRPHTGRVIGGVCAALANRFGWDVVLVRVLAALSILLPGPQVLAYLIAWIVIPGDSATPAAPASGSEPTPAGVPATPAS
jgi:phage shock protein PspC (stress-responsive transcriptional regulator)